MPSRFPFLLILLFAFPNAVAARTQITTGVIQGDVLDSTGAVLPGVTVLVRTSTPIFSRAGRPTATAASSSSSCHRDATPRHLQAARLRHVRAGGDRADGRPVGHARAAAGSVATPGDGDRQRDAGVETTRAAVATTLNETVVETTPILGRKFEDLLTLTPGVSIVQGPDGDEITFAGQRGVFNNISLDGGDFNNGFFGEQVGGQRAAIDITLDAVKEFQVIASGAPAEFGRTAGGVVNVITKSGTNDTHGSRLPLSAARSADRRAVGRHARWRSSIASSSAARSADPSGATARSTSARSKGITGDFQRPNLSSPIGTPCPVPAPTLAPERSAHRQRRPTASGWRCSNFFQTRLGQDEGQPHRAPDQDGGDAAEGRRQPERGQPPRRLLQLQPLAQGERDVRRRDLRHLGERHRRRSGAHQRAQRQLVHDARQQQAERVPFHVLARDAARARRTSRIWLRTPGSASCPSFRFGNPFFLQPNVDELIWRTQFKDNFSIVRGRHTLKVGGEWMHTLNDQVFRGFFTGRYLFDSVTGFLRYASPAAPGGFGPRTVGCSNGSYVTLPASCPAGSAPTGGPLLFYLQGAGRTGPGHRCSRRVEHHQRGAVALRPGSVAGALEHHAAVRPALGCAADAGDRRSATTAFARFLSNPTFPSDGTIPDQWSMWQPRVGATWDVRGDGRSVVRASAGIYFARQNMLSQVGSVTTNGLQQQTIFVSTDLNRQFGVPAPTWPGVLTPPALPEGVFPLSPACACSIATTRTRASTRSTSATSRSSSPNWSGYADYTYAARAAPDAVPQLQPRHAGLLRRGPGHRQRLRLLGPAVRPTARRGDGDDEPRAIATTTA